MPDFSLECAHEGLVAGCDEAGCGPWAGPVVAAAVIFPDYKALPTILLNMLEDSKKLTPQKRENAFNFLNELNTTQCHNAIAQASVEEIDTLNIRQAAMLAMQRALEALPFQPRIALIDGITHPKVPFPTQCVKQGDTLSFSIAAASILAKVTRDRLMQTLAREFPPYGWERNAGYGTAHHQEALKKHGVTLHHRRTFAPIALLLQT
jgi:ribonuclease HII